MLSHPHVADYSRGRVSVAARSVESMDTSQATSTDVILTGSELTDRDREMLEFERLRWKHLGAREAAIRDRFDMSLTRYAQVLNALIDRPEALAHDPLVVNRLRRLRDQRSRHRASKRS